MLKFNFHTVLLGLFLLFSFTAKSQRVISGFVTDEQSKQAIPFANIALKNQAKGSMTDTSGYFEIPVNTENQTVIIVSHLNYLKQEIKLNDSLFSKPLNIVLSPKSLQLSDVVVSAGLYEQNMDKISLSAEIITHREVLNDINSNLTDLLASTPGFTQVWEYHSPIILRGLNSNRLIIMKDGNRRIGTFPGGYFGQDLNVYDNRKIEIIKGPGSVIYGSGAISGIINLVGNDVFGTNHNAVQLHSAYGTNNQEFLEMFKACHKREKFGISVHGKYRKTGNMIYANGEKAENSNVEDRDIALSTGFRFSDKHDIKLNANYHYGDWGKPRGFNGPTKYFTQIRNREENYHGDLAWAYAPNKFVQSVNLNLFYDKGWRDYYQYKYSTVSGNLSSLNLVHYQNNYGGGRAYSILDLSENNKLTNGADAYYFRINDPTEVIDYYNETQGVLAGSKNAGQQNIGAFLNNEWDISAAIRFVAGIRYDLATVLEGETNAESSRQEIRNAFSGNTGLVVSPTKDMHISFNAGRAFRMPTTEEMFTRTISCQGIKLGNAELQPEYGWNFDLGFRGYAFKQNFKYDLALFHNQLQNFISMAPSDQADVDFTFKNKDAKLYGGELSAQYRIESFLSQAGLLYLNLGASYIYGEDLSGDTPAPLFGIPPVKVQFDVHYRGKLNRKHISGYSLKLSPEYVAAQNRVAAIPEGTDGGPWGYIPSEQHFLFHVSAGINANSLPGKPKLRLVVKNLFNNDYQPFGSYIPAMGRNIKILLSFNF